MKKYVWMVALFAALAMVFTGCGGGGGTQYTVTFDKNFAENVPTTVTAAGIPASYKVDAGSKITKPADPTRSDDKAFQGWYKEWNQVTAWNFETDTIIANTTLYAKWEGETPPPPPPPLEQADDVVRFLYTNGTYADITFEAGETKWSDVTGLLRKPKDYWNDDTKNFRAWQDQTNTIWNDGTATIQAKMTMTPVWFDGVFSGATTGASKVYLEDTTYAIYEFDISALGVTVPEEDTAVEALAKITTIKADYGMSEAALEIYKGNTRAWRAFGPYFFNATALEGSYGSPTVVTRDFYGDFVYNDVTNAFVTRLDGTASLPGTFNKFHPYMCYSSGSWDTTTNVSATPTANTWFTTTYPLNSDADGTSAPGAGNYTYGKTLRLLEGVLTDGKDGTVQVIPANTNLKKVYFAVGLTRANAGNSTKDSGSHSVWDHGIVSYIKNVTLVWDDNGTSKEIIGTPATLSVVISGETKTSNKVYTGYVNPQNYSWTGAPDAPVVIVPSPDYVPPVEATPATENLYVITSAAPLKNTTAIVGNYQAVHWIELPFPSGLTLGSYFKYTIKAKFYEADGTTEIPSAGGLGQIRFVTSSTDQTGVGGAIYNLNQETISVTPPALASGSADVKYILVSNSSADVAFIEITEVTLWK